MDIVNMMVVGRYENVMELVYESGILFNIMI
jgi:hypothetical protein